MAWVTERYVVIDEYGNPVVKTRQVWKPPASTPQAPTQVHPQHTQPSAPAPAPQPAQAPRPAQQPHPQHVQPPQRFVFQGKVYTSLAAYQKAVQAHKAYIAASQEQARRLQEKARQEAAARARLAAQAAARAAAEKAEAERLIWHKKAQAQAAEARKAAEAAAEARLAAREAEQRARRGRAWDDAQRGTGILMSEYQQHLQNAREAAYVKDQALQKSQTQAYNKTQLLAPEKKVGRGVPLLHEDRQTRITQQQIKEEQLLAQARQTGNYDRLLDEMEAQAKATGGRYVNAELLNRAAEEQHAREADIIQRYEESTQHAYDLLAKDPDGDSAYNYYMSKKHQDLIAEYERMSGKGRTPGESEKFWRRVDGLVEMNNDYRTRLSLGTSGSRAVYTQEALQRMLNDLKEELAYEHTELVVDSRGVQHEITTKRSGLDIYLNRIERENQLQMMLKAAENGLLPKDDPAYQAWLKRQLPSVRERVRQAEIRGARGRHIQSEMGYEKGRERVQKGDPDYNSHKVTIDAQGNRWREVDIIKWRENLVEEAHTYWRAGGLSDHEIGRLKHEQVHGLSGEREMAKTLLTQAMERGYDKLNPRPATSGGRAWVRTHAASTAYERGRNNVLGRLTSELFGENYGAMEKLMRVGGVAGGMRVLGAGAGAIGTLTRMMHFGGQMLMGRNPFGLTQGLDVGLWGRNMGIRSYNEAGQAQGTALGWDESAEAQAKSREEWERFLAGIANSDDRLAQLDAIIEFGMGGLTTGGGRRNNLNILFQLPMDPLIGMPLSFGMGRLLASGRLAMAQAGGLSAIRSGQVPLSAVLRNTRYLSLPGGNKRNLFGNLGAGRATRLREEHLMKIAREAEIPYSEVQFIPKDDLVELANRIARGVKDPENLEWVTGKSQLWKSNPAYAQQILTAVQSNLDSWILRGGGHSIDPFDVGANLRKAQVMAKAAKRELDAVVSRQAADRVAIVGGRALRSVIRQGAKARGKPLRDIILKEQPNPMAKALAKDARLGRAYTEAVEKQAELAKAASDAADILKNVDVQDVKVRLDAYRVMTQALDELGKYTDQMVETPMGRAIQPGITTARRNALHQYRMSMFGGTIENPRVIHFTEVANAQLKRTAAWVRGQRKIAEKHLQDKNLTPGQRRYWHGELGRLDAADAAIQLEQQLNAGVKKVVAYAKKHYAPLILDRIGEQTIARWAASVRGGRLEAYRRVQSRFDNAELVPGVSWDDLALTADDLMSMQFVVVPALRQRRFIPTGGAADNILRETGEMNLMQAYHVITAGMGDPHRFRMFNQAFNRSLKPQLEKMLADSGTDLRRFGEYVRHQHMLVPDMRNNLGWNSFRTVEKRVHKAIVKARGGDTRKGAVRVSRTAGEEAKPYIPQDFDPVVVLAKYNELDKRGISMFAYDEARGVLGDLSIQHNTGLLLRRQARLIARQTGEKPVEVFKRLRNERRLAYAEADLEAFFSQPHMTGLTPEEMFHLWEQKHALSEMAPQPRKITVYQQRTLNNAIRDMTGIDAMQTFKPRDRAVDAMVRRRILGSFDDIPEGTRRAAHADFPEIPKALWDEWAGTPMIMVKSQDELLALIKDAPPVYGYVNTRGRVLINNEGIFIQEGTSWVTLVHEMYHAWNLTPHNFAGRAQLENMWKGFTPEQRKWLHEVFGYPVKPDQDLLKLGGEEAFASMYSSWFAYKNGLKFPKSGYIDDMANRRTIEWSKIREAAQDNPNLVRILDEVEFRFADVRPADPSHFGFGIAHPPFGNRAAMRQWLVDVGHWSPATADDIASGKRVWSITDERRFWETNYGYTPEWTNPELLKPILKDPDAYANQMRKWGFFDDDFEMLAAMNFETVKKNPYGVVAFGAGGVKRARTYVEMRQWFFDRYGGLVGTLDDQGRLVLHEVPWMMDNYEYVKWMGRQAADPDWFPNPKMIRGEQLVVFRQIVEKRIETTLKRWKKRHDLDPSKDWLPEERMKFAMEVTDDLLHHQGWRKWWQRKSIVERGLEILGLQRTLVTMTFAFPIVNAIDAFTSKAIMISIAKNRGIYIYASKHARRVDLVPDLQSVGGDSYATWGVDRQRNFYGRIADRTIPLKDNWAEGDFTRVVTQSGGYASKLAEDKLRLATARVVAGNAYEAFLKQGMDPELAAALSRMEAAKVIKQFYSILEGAPAWERALNQMVPFFTYHYKNTGIAIRLLHDKPWLIRMFEELGDALEGANELWWNENYPDDPFPYNDPRVRQLWIQPPWSDVPYVIDLSVFSDWTRAMAGLQKSKNVLDMISNFLRVPHPLQMGIAAAIGGWDTPWGNPGHWREVHPFIDFFLWASGQDYSDPRKQRDFLQITSQMMFFKKFGRIDPITAKVSSFFGMMEMGDNAAAWQYYEANPDLAEYFALNGRRLNPYNNTIRPSWFTHATDEQKSEYAKALRGYFFLRDSLDEALDNFYLEPWNPEYRTLKKARFALIAKHLHDNPILADVWGFWMTAQEFADSFEKFKTDMGVEAYFSIKRPQRKNFTSDFLYAKAMADYRDARILFLESRPDVARQLFSGRNAVERAWYEHELQMDEILSREAHLRVRIAEEEAKLTGNYEADAERREFISFLYEMSRDNYMELDAESFGRFRDIIGSEKGVKRLLGAARYAAAGLMERVVVFPGQADRFYLQADAAGRRVIEADEKYYGALGDMMAEMKKKGDFSEFWTELTNRGLHTRYLKENPNKRIDYQYAMDIAAHVKKYGKFFWQGLFENPELAKRYLQRNPHKVVDYNYHWAMDQLWKSIGGDFRKFRDALAKNPWLEGEYFRRNPDKKKTAGQTRYAQIMGHIVRTAKSGAEFYRMLEQHPDVMNEYFRRYPEREAKYRAGKAYFNALTPWINALNRGDFVGAQNIWNNLPQWVRDRYLAGGEGRRGGGGGGGGGVYYNGRWFKSNESRDRYIKYIEGGGSDRNYRFDQQPSGQQFRSPEARQRFLDGQAYFAAMGRWVELLKAKQFVEANAHFNGLPDWMKEKYFTKNPGQRARLSLDKDVLRAGANYFLASGDDKLKVLASNPELRAFINRYGGEEGVHRGLITAIYAAIPSSEPWLKRTFRERYPEIFSQEAQGEQRLSRVARKLAENPEMEPFYQKALAMQYAAYREQLKRDKKPPPQWSIERQKRLRQRRKRRVARFHSKWKLHRDLRRYQSAA